jgi:hypothetical protein
MSDSEFIKIEPKDGTLTIQFAGEEPLIVIKGNDEGRAADYAKILRPDLLAKMVDEIKMTLAERPSGLSSSESGNLARLLKVFEQEL